MAIAANVAMAARSCGCWRPNICMDELVAKLANKFCIAAVEVGGAEGALDGTGLPLVRFSSGVVLEE